MKTLPQILSSETTYLETVIWVGVAVVLGFAIGINTKSHTTKAIMDDNMEQAFYHGYVAGAEAIGDITSEVAHGKTKEEQREIAVLRVGADLKAFKEKLK